MAARIIRRPAQAAAQLLADAVDQALGMPLAPTRRGRRCPPPPFGETVRWSHVYQRASDGAYLIEAPPPRADGVAVTIRGTRVTIDLSEAEDDDGSDRSPVGRPLAGRPLTGRPLTGRR